MKLVGTVNDCLVSTQAGYHVTLQEKRYQTSRFYRFLNICFFTFIYEYSIQV